MKYSLAIFDMDGTILNTIEDITVSINVALEKQGYPIHTVDEIRSFVGNGVRKLVERAVPKEATTEQMDAVMNAYLEHYNANCDINTAPYNGVIDAIKKLRENGIKTAVISNKGDAEVQKLCVKYFDGLFDFALGERPDLEKKPSAEPVEFVLKEFGIAKEDAIFIGDSETDIQTAQNAKMNCIAVTWGFRDVELLKSLGVDHLAVKPEDIINIVL